MLFREICQEKLLPDDEVVINKKLKFKGIDAVLASITINNSDQTLWMLLPLKSRAMAMKTMNQ